MIPMLDSHCHVDFIKNRELFKSDLIKEKLYVIGVTNLPSLFEKNRVVIPETKFLKHALGYHPELISQFPDQLEIFKRNIVKTRYIGEVGIDAISKHAGTLNLQLEIFERIVRLCNDESDKIMTVHSRKAEQIVLDTFNENFKGKVILHWYTGNPRMAETALSKGFYFSINNKMLSSKKGRELVYFLPMERLLLESDYPFTNKSQQGYSFDVLNEIINKISFQKKLSFEETKKMLHRNTLELLS